ncbi:MAG: ATP-dependent DNA ligase [Nanoarchaeota archaeon]
MRYSELAQVYDNIQSTAKRLEKTSIIAEFLKKIPDRELDVIVLLMQGKVFHSWDERKLGVAAKTVVKAINVATGIGVSIIEDEWRKTGDLGLVAEKLVGKKKQSTLFSSELEVEKVYNNIVKLATLEGMGTVDARLKLVAELLTSAKPMEARYIVRTVLEDLRVGVGEGLVRDAIVWAYFGEELGVFYDAENNKLNFPEQKREQFEKYVDAVQFAYNLKNDFSEVIRIARSQRFEGLQNTAATVGKPMKSMLFQKAKDMGEAFRVVGKPAAIEYKYDGFRVQVHYNEGDVKLFTRRLEDVTKQFPDVVKSIRDNVRCNTAILDTEIVGFNPKTNQYISFQEISQRIKRKYNIEAMIKKYPVEVNVFDIMYYNGKMELESPFNKRRKLISQIVEPKTRSIVLSRIMVTDKKDEAVSFYNEALDMGEEGVMVKNLQGDYRPGLRVGKGVKLKPVMDSLELVVVEAEWGEGKRANWLTSFTLAAMDENKELKAVGKVSTGLKELESEGTTYKYLTDIMTPLIVSQKGRKARLKPDVVIEVNYEEIQKSTTYESGFALRFPRFVRLREERGVEDADTISHIEKLYKGQRNRDKYGSSVF